MAQMIIQHEVQDYDKWKSIFDLSLPIRKMSGEKSSRIFRGMENPNDLTILIDWKDLDKASDYAESEDLRVSMKQAGVIGTPRVYLADEDVNG